MVATLENIAHAHQKNNLHTQALKSFLKIVEIKRELYDTFIHPSIAESLNDIGFLLYKMSNFKQAFEFQV